MKISGISRGKQNYIDWKSSEIAHKHRTCSGFKYKDTVILGVLALSSALLNQKTKVKCSKESNSHTKCNMSLPSSLGGIGYVGAGGGVPLGVKSSKGIYTPGVSLEALLGVSQPFLFSRLPHNEKGVPDSREIFQQGSQAIAVCHDLTPKSIVRHTAVQSEKSEEMISRRWTKVFVSFPERSTSLKDLSKRIEDLIQKKVLSGSGCYCLKTEAWTSSKHLLAFASDALLCVRG